MSGKLKIFEDKLILGLICPVDKLIFFLILNTCSLYNYYVYQCVHKVQERQIKLIFTLLVTKSKQFVVLECDLVLL